MIGMPKRLNKLRRYPRGRLQPFLTSRGYDVLSVVTVKMLFESSALFIQENVLIQLKSGPAHGDQHRSKVSTSASCIRNLRGRTRRV